MKKQMKRMALFMSLLATMATTACLTACDLTGEDDEETTPNALDYVSINITRCERVGNVLQIDYDVKNKNNANVALEISSAQATDNNGTKYSGDIATGSDSYYNYRNITITGKNTIQGHAKFYDFDPLNTAKSIKLTLRLRVTNITSDEADYTNNKVAITDNRVIANGVQTNDTSLAWKVKSCTRNAEGQLLLEFTLTNNTGIALEKVNIFATSVFDNIGNRYGADVRWGTERDYYNYMTTNIATNGTVEGSVLVDNFNASASEVNVYLKNEIDNYIPSDDTVRFLTIPVTKQ